MQPNSRAAGKRSAWRRASVAQVIACATITACGEPNLPREDRPSHASSAHEVEFAPVPAVAPGETPTLLQELAARPRTSPQEWEQELREWVLPYKTKRLDIVLILGVAQGDTYVLSRVLAPHAQWGMPDRRMLGARPIFGEDGGQEFFDALHRAAMRFPENASWKSQATLDGVTAMYQTGAEPMWTYFEREGAGDWIVLRKVMFKGRPVIDYVGLWPKDPPTEPTQTHVSLGPPPPLAPPVDRSMLPDMGLPPPM